MSHGAQVAPIFIFIFLRIYDLTLESDALHQKRWIA